MWLLIKQLEFASPSGAAHKYSFEFLLVFSSKLKTALHYACGLNLKVRKNLASKLRQGTKIQVLVCCPLPLSLLTLLWPPSVMKIVLHVGTCLGTSGGDWHCSCIPDLSVGAVPNPCVFQVKTRREVATCLVLIVPPAFSPLRRKLWSTTLLLTLGNVFQYLLVYIKISCLKLRPWTRGGEALVSLWIK